MFCQNCGEEIDNESKAMFCPKCGFKLNQNNTAEEEFDDSKTGIGILLGVFLGIIGLIIGLCLYKEGTYARTSFVKAWAITFVISCIIAVIAYFCLISASVNAVNDALDSLDNSIYF